MDFIICVIGMVMVIEGIPYFASPDKMKKVLEVVLNLPDSNLRRFGFFMMAGGIALVYIGKRII